MKITSKDPGADILKARPLLKPKSIQMYVGQLERLQAMFGAKNFNFLGKPGPLMEKIDDLNYLTQRNAVNAVIVLLMALNADDRYDVLLKTYGDIRDKFNDKYNAENGAVISEKQSPNFATSDEIFEMLKKMKDDLKDVSSPPTKKEKQLLQAYTLFSIYARMPMRNDVAGMVALDKSQFNKLSKEDRKDNNYLIVSKDGLSFILDDYKTRGKFGTLEIDVEDKELEKILMEYIQVNGLGVLFKTSTEKPLTRIELSKTLLKYSDRYMGKKISTTLLRKIYLSSKYGTDGGLKEQLVDFEKDNKMMAHSKEVALGTYVKKQR